MPPSSGVPQPHPPTKPQKPHRLHPLPGPMPPPSGVPLHPNKKNGTRQFQHCQTPEPKHPSNRPIQYIINIRYPLNSITTRKFSQQLKIAGLHFNIRSQLLTLRANIRHLKNAPLTNPTPGNRTTKCRKLRMILLNVFHAFITFIIFPIFPILPIPITNTSLSLTSMFFYLLTQTQPPYKPYSG